MREGSLDNAPFGLIARLITATLAYARTTDTLDKRRYLRPKRNPSAMTESITNSIHQGDLAKFFAWARTRAYAEFDNRMAANPELDPNWTFSEIMQDLLTEYQSPSHSATSSDAAITE